MTAPVAPSAWVDGTATIKAVQFLPEVVEFGESWRNFSQTRSLPILHPQ
jgi:hypothetical protein